jgi:hypothetical protein
LQDLFTFLPLQLHDARLDPFADDGSAPAYYVTTAVEITGDQPPTGILWQGNTGAAL